MEGPKCVKCGRNLKKAQVFCDDCLAVAAKYPVDPSTPVTLPTHSPKKVAPRKKQLTPEEQLARSKVAIRWLVITSLGLVVSLVLCIMILS